MRFGDPPVFMSHELGQLCNAEPFSDDFPNNESLPLAMGRDVLNPAFCEHRFPPPLNSSFRVGEKKPGSFFPVRFRFHEPALYPIEEKGLRFGHKFSTSWTTGLGMRNYELNS